MRLAAVSIAAATVGVLAWSPAAHAYVRQKSATTGVPFAWKTGCVQLTAFPADIANLTRTQTSAAIAGAAAAWSKQDPTVGACSYLDLMVTVAPDAAAMPPAQNDGVNEIGFRQDGWCSRTDPTICYDPAALALTSLSASTSTGAIRDADIEVNAYLFTWADLAANPGGGVHDLQAALTHEMGHVLGFDHTCYLDASAGIPTDQNGNPIPDCASASAAVMATTMFPGSATDTGPRTLAPDDQQAVCDSYPIASDPMSCPPPILPDAGTDAAQMDAAPDVGGGTPDATTDAATDARAKSGCGCALAHADHSIGPLSIVAIFLLFARRRLRSRAESGVSGKRRFGRGAKRR